MRFALAVVALVSSADATPARADGFPTALRGLWAETPEVCEVLRRAPASVPPDRYWLHISADHVNGTSAGTLLKAVGPHAAQATAAGNPSLVVEYALAPGGRLRETVASENTAMQYVHCR